MHSPEAKRRDIVLVVDDSPETLAFLTDALDHAGYTALIARDAASALALVDRITPDLVLLDAMLPGMDGFALCRQFKQSPLLRHLPVIFLTGFAQSAPVVEALESGGVDYLLKPIVVEELLARVRVHLDNARRAQGSRAALDATGRYLLSLGREGALNWSTPRARSLLEAAVPQLRTAPDVLPPALVRGLLRLAGPESGGGHHRIVMSDKRTLEFAFVSATGADEFLFCLGEINAGDDLGQLQHAFSLTAREAEVLLWLSRGKTNRDIAEILAIRPRTINKHLERVFEKLGVENRAAAAVHAVRALTRAADAHAVNSSMPS